MGAKAGSGLEARIRGQEHWSPAHSSPGCASTRAAGFRPGARRVMGRPSRCSRSVPKSAVPSARPVVSADWIAVNPARSASPAIPCPY